MTKPVPTPTIAQSLDNIEAELRTATNAHTLNGEFKGATQAIAALACLDNLRLSVAKLRRIEADTPAD